MIITNEERNYLINSMRDLLDEYDYEYSTIALNEIIDVWATSKAGLIQEFKNHTNYLEGQFMIAFDTDYERVVNKEGSRNFSYYITNLCSRREFIDMLPKEVDDKRIDDDCTYLPYQLYQFLENLSVIATRTISEETATEINEMLPNIHAHTGEKTSRVINRICTYLGYNKHEDYNKEFAKYADSLSPLKIRRHTILSINPLDYLTMSFGNSWASCHTIDKANKRGMPNSYEGQYSSGTMSYMLDETSMVFYTVDASYDGTEYWDQPKINRQMFHYGKDKLIQGRLYPQSNDYEGEDYTPNRNIVQKIISDIYGFANLWTIKKGTEAARQYVTSRGTHYEDYRYFEKCSLSRIKGSENEEYITIGHAPICIECGGIHDVSESINCCHIPNARICADCGCVIECEDDAIWVDGEYYCRDCVSWCDICEEYHRSEGRYIERDRIEVCEYCFDEYYYTCRECGEYVHRDDVYYVEEGDYYICQDCYEDDYATCTDCGEIFKYEDMQEYDDELYCPHCYKKAVKEEEEAC